MPPRPLRRIHPRPSFSRAGIEAREVATLFEAVEIGEVLTYEDIKAMTGIDLQQKRHLIDTIRQLVRQEQNIILHVHNNIGYERLSESGKVDEGEEKLRRIHRATQRLGHIYQAVDMTQLSALDQHRYLAHQSLSTALFLWTHHHTRHELAQQKYEPPELPYDATAHTDLFQHRPQRPDQ